MVKKRKTIPFGEAAFQKAWKRAHDGQTDTWNVEYVYEYGARKLWRAALRYARSQSTSEGKPT
jgi:hypothetical protein